MRLQPFDFKQCILIHTLHLNAACFELTQSKAENDVRKGLLLWESSFIHDANFRLHLNIQRTYHYSLSLYRIIPKINTNSDLSLIVCYRWKLIEYCFVVVLEKCHLIVSFLNSFCVSSVLVLKCHKHMVKYNIICAHLKAQYDDDAMSTCVTPNQCKNNYNVLLMLNHLACTHVDSGFPI